MAAHYDLIFITNIKYLISLKCAIKIAKVTSILTHKEILRVNDAQPWLHIRMPLRVFANMQMPAAPPCTTLNSSVEGPRISSFRRF